MVQLTETWRRQYEAQFSAMQIHPAKLADAEDVARKIEEHKAIYEAISARVNGFPWFLIGCLHEREASLNFSAYLGDGEALNHPTHCVPHGRGPFPDFEAGAVDALVHEGFEKVTDWPLGSILWHAESWNGWGYFGKHVPSPYVWAGTSVYTAGKYVADGRYDPHAIDSQLGVAVILCAMQKLGFIDLAFSTPAENKQAGEIQPTAAEGRTTATPNNSTMRATAGQSSVVAALPAGEHWPAPSTLPIGQETKETTQMTTVTLPAATLSAAANVSTTTVATTTGLASLGGILAIAGPLLASFFPNMFGILVGVASTLPGVAVAAGATVHAMHLSAQATALTDSIIASVTNASNAVTSSLGGATA